MHNQALLPSQGVADLGMHISVCLLTYNHAHLIASTLRSILDQTLSGYEIIVSDDCSSDGTWEEILQIARTDARVRPLRTPQNLGMAGNANYAVGHSTRRYIALLHHDDLYRADLLEKWAAVLERHPKAGFAFNQYSVLGSYKVYSEELAECTHGPHFLHAYLLPRWGCPVRGTAMIRRIAWEAVGGLRPRFGLLADVDLWMRLSMQWDVCYVPAPIIHVRQNRPDDYPADYKETEWSWRRYRLLCEIHAENRLARYDLHTIRGRAQWWRFRARLSSQTATWLVYGVVRGKSQMLAEAAESATPFDMWPVRALRWVLLKMYRPRAATVPNEH